MTKSAGPMASLSAKQARFVEEYLVDLNATQAAIRAGYSEKTAKQQGQRLLTNAYIQAAVADGRDQRSERTNITQDYVLESIYSTMERCKQSEAVTDKSGKPVLTENADGNMVPAYTFNAMGVYKGAEMLGRHLGMFEDKTGGDAEVVADALNNIADKLNG